MTGSMSGLRDWKMAATICVVENGRGYIPDTQKKTVYVKSGETTEIEWKNTPSPARSK